LVCEWGGRRFAIVDTGGMDIADTSPIARGVAKQAQVAVREADLVLLVVDARAGVTPGDEELAAILRRSGRPVLVLANKVDDPAREELTHEFHRLGLGEPVPISAMHGHGTGDLLDEIVARLPGGGEAEAGAEAIGVAILGRPNVGKSSLLNALLGQERVIVSDMPGTTRDAIDTVLRRGGETFVLVDTAGIRRKRRQRQGIEYYSELRALEAAERADVALVLAKWDAATVSVEDVRPRLEARLRQRPPIVVTSATTGRGISRLLDRVAELYAKHARRIATPELNRFLDELREAREPPSRAGKRLNLLYGTQTGVRPPRFRVFVNDPGLITRDYAYWVENRLRDRFGMQGVPVSIDFVRRS